MDSTENDMLIEESSLDRGIDYNYITAQLSSSYIS